MSSIETLLASVVLYANLEHVRELQASGASALPAVAAVIADVVAAVSAELFQGVVDDLTHPNVEGCIADRQRAQECRASGTAAFAARRYAEAALHYSAALRWAEEATATGAELASRLYCNRALCFAKLGANQRALADSTCAAARDPRFAKAHYRKALAHRALGDVEAAAADAQSALKLQQDGGEDTAAVEALLAALAARRQAEQPAAPAWTTHDVPLGMQEEVEAESRSASCTAEEAAAFAQSVSPALSVQQHGGAGRELSAAQAVPAGVDVFREGPFAHALCKSHRQTNCAHCCVDLPDVGAWYCERCPMVAYCSSTCRSADSFHQPGGPECGLPWPVLLPSDVVLALRLARKLQRNASTVTATVRSLETHVSSLSAEDLVHLTVLAAVTQAAWQRAAERAATGSDAPLSAVEVLGALCQVHINALAIVPAQRSSAADRVGVGIYPAASFMNHACVPTVAVRFEGNTLVARSVAPLEAGAPLLHCYGPQLGEMTARQRRAMLEEQYHFACTCTACTYPSKAEAAMVGLRCTRAGCGGALPAPCAADAGVASKYDLPSSTAACTECGAVLAEAAWRGELLPVLTRAQELYETGCKGLQQWEGSDGEGAEAAIGMLRESLRLRQKVLHTDNQALGATHDALGVALQAAGDGAAAAPHLLASLRIAECNFPAGSTNVAFQQLKAEAALRADKCDEDLRQADSLRQSALQVLQLHFGAAVAEAALDF